MFATHGECFHTLVQTASMAPAQRGEYGLSPNCWQNPVAVQSYHTLRIGVVSIGSQVVCSSLHIFDSPWQVK